MPNSTELNDFEKVIMSVALAKGKVDYNDVSGQIDILLKETEDQKSRGKSSWETFNQTIAKLKRLELLDEKNRPNPVRLIDLPTKFLHDAIYKAHKRIKSSKEILKE
jgi:hypothetical protein